MSTAYLSRWSGPGLESADPYSGTCDGPSIIPVNEHTQRVEILPPLPSRTKTVADYNLIKQYVHTKGAVYTTFYWDSSQYNDKHAAYRFSGTASYNNHAVTVIGWDDSYPASNFNNPPSRPGALLIKNSWGTEWGQSGYFWISYYDVSVGTEDNGFFYTEPITNYKTEYQYDPLGWDGSLGTGTTTAWGANVFTASRTETLSAVSFYATTSNTQYQLFIHTDPTAGPSGGATYAEPSGTFSVPGYYTVKLSTPVPVFAGHKFSVIIKMTGGTYPPAAERAMPPTSEAAAHSGQSYYSASGNAGTWRDVTTDYPNSNLCIKAFTTAGPLPTTFSISTSTTTPTTNVPFTLTGSLKSGTTALTNQPVHLERRTYASGAWGGWANVANTYKYTNATGIIKLAQTVATAGMYQYRWHYNGTTTYQQAYSTALTETVKKPITLTITTSPATPVFGKPFTISGTLKTGTTGLVGYTVHLERKVGTGAWTDVSATTKTTGSGGAIPSISQTMTTHTTYSYRWHFAGTGTYQARYSPAKTLTV